MVGNCIGQMVVIIAIRNMFVITIITQLEIYRRVEIMFLMPPYRLGSERTGPDLSYIGRKRGEAWEIEHLKNPRKLSPMSIMPSFEFFPNADLQALGTYLYNLGDQNTAAWMIQPPVDYATVVDPQKYELVPQPSGTDSVGWPLFKSPGIFEGKEIYVNNCQTCHGCAGNGLGTYAGVNVVTPANFKVEPFNKMSDEEWIWHVSEGVPGSVMPPWRESLTKFTALECDSLYSTNFCASS